MSRSRGPASWLLLAASLATALAALPAPATGLTVRQSTGDVVFAPVATWPLPQAPGEPVDLALLPGGLLFVADGRENAVLVYGGDGAPLARWDDPPTGPLPGYTYVPTALASDPDQMLVYVLWQRYRVDATALTASGLFLDPRRPDGEPARPLQALTFMASATDVALDRGSGDLFFRTGEGVTRLSVPGGVPLSGFQVGPGAGRLAVTRDGQVVVTRPEARAVDYYSRDGAPAGRTALGQLVPLDVAADGVGVQVLVRAPSAADPGAPLVVRLDSAGRTLGQVAAADVVAPVPPQSDWPWSIGWASDGSALVTGSTRFQVHRFGSPAASPRPLHGGPLRPAFAPHAEDATLVGASVALTLDHTGSLVALDERAAQAYRFDRGGGAALAAIVPEHAIDLAVDAGGALYVASDDGRLRRIAGDGSGRPVWDVACDCSLGGRLAAAPGVVYLTRPREQRVVALDPRTGATVRHVQVTGGVGLWPSDIAADPFGRLYTADLVTARVHAWMDPGTPESVWLAGLLSGPRRVSYGRMPDGAAVIASIMADGFVELHATVDGNLIGRWRPHTVDGREIDAADVAVGPGGEIYLSDARSRTVHVFEAGGGVPGTPEPTAEATPTPADGACDVRGAKVAAPDRVVLGQTVAVTLTLAADCPDRARLLGADIVLVIDRSASMQGVKFEAARGAARTFAEMLDVRYHRLALASFSDDASVDVPLTDSVPAVIDGLAALETAGGTHIAAALERARTNLETFGRSDALPVIVLLSDGRNNEHRADPRPVAAAVRAWGAQIYTIGLGVDVDKPMLREIAGRDDAFFFAPTPSELFPIYGEILRAVVSSLAGNLVIDDQLEDGIRYVSGSASPLALESPGRLRWGRSILPSSGLALTYRVRAEAEGCRPVSRRAVADYTDGDGARRQFTFPVPTLCVVVPTASPPPSPTPTRTPPPPTRVPARIHLPVAYRHACTPSVAHADVVLLVDTSSSMDGAKLSSARVAATVFTGYLDFPDDRAAVIGFDIVPHVAVQLSGDPDAVERAILGLRLGSGTRIDLALAAAAAELRSPRRSPGNRAVVVLLSDGGQAGSAAPVIDRASELHALGATIFAVGLGDDADPRLLEAVAGDRARYFYAPTGEDLEDIYRAIAVKLPCK